MSDAQTADLPVRIPADATVVARQGPPPFVTAVRYVRADGRVVDWQARIHRKAGAAGSRRTRAHLVGGLALRHRVRLLRRGTGTCLRRARRRAPRCAHVLRRLALLHDCGLPHVPAGRAGRRALVVRMDATKHGVLGGRDRSWSAPSTSTSRRSRVFWTCRRTWRTGSSGAPTRSDRCASWSRRASPSQRPGTDGGRGDRASVTGTSRPSTCGVRSSSACRPSARTIDPAGSITSVQLANRGTFLGAVCFLVASLLMMGEGGKSPSEPGG